MKLRFLTHLSDKLLYFCNQSILLNRRYRVILLSIFDIIVLLFSFSISLYFVTEYSFTGNISYLNQYIPPLCFISLFVYKFTGQYKTLTRFFSGNSVYYIPLRILTIVFLVNIYRLIFELPIFPKNFWLLFILFLLILTISARIFIRDYLRFLSINNLKTPKRIVIYGAGEGGALLLSSLKYDKNYEVRYFVDDNNFLKGCNISSVPIRNLDFLSKNNSDIDYIVLAIPSLSSKNRRKILKRLQNYNIPVLTIPTILELAKKKVSTNLIKPINIEDLLGRDVVLPDSNLLRETVSRKIIFISGSGGSIGSELCRQLIHSNPKRIILFDHNEHSLYKLFNELRNSSDGIELIPILGCATDLNLLLDIFERYKVDIIFHAAAYKHVPLVEFNPLTGLKNNILSSRSICEAALKARVSSAVLISSDKAVRPTNVMGASKRISELIFQSYSEFITKSEIFSTKFSMVRFGNVLNSSGSVLPLFTKQISEGGPVTITHKDMTRFFMTIPEAAQLVIQSSALAKGGDLFLLDMGSPMKISELAETIINLSGFTIKSNENPKGEIEIIYTGLRPGEKLYEELLIDSKSIPTVHPLIYRSEEPYISYIQFWPILDKLEKNLNAINKDETLKIILNCVSEAEFKSFYEENIIKNI